jgi:hypothetical protein
VYLLRYCGVGLLCPVCGEYDSYGRLASGYALAACDAVVIFLGVNLGQAAPSGFIATPFNVQIPFLKLAQS